ncbi:MAG TPA: YetF domain-containing protein [Longimicrobiaceae bacterium]|nr:YetF domain-containing protein [Longimicrobiaceae bacterium]
MGPVVFFFGGWEPILRIAVVGTLGYVTLGLLLRLMGKRTLAQMNAFDFIVTVALGAAFGRTLTARSVAFAEAVAAFTLLVILQYAFSWFRLRSPTLARVLTAPPALLFFRGEFLRETMRREQVTELDLRSAIREHGVGSFEQVEAIVFEPDGTFAVIPADQAGDGSALPEMMRG